MASKKTIIQVLLSILLQLFVIGVLMSIFNLFISPFYMVFLFTMMSYLIIFRTLRQRISQNHMKSVLLYKEGNYAQAIEECKKSYDFFCKYPWLDKYRYIILLSYNRISYSEMALLNIAFCYEQSGDAELSKQYYQKTLEIFPDSEVAKSALEHDQRNDKC